MTTFTHARRLLLTRFVRAWQRHDIDAVMSCFSADCIYEASVGPEPGETFRGQEAVRAGILKMFDYDQGTTSRVHHLMIVGNRACWEWTYTLKTATRAIRAVRGCDIFEFKGTKIRRKSGFRKTNH